MQRAVEGRGARASNILVGSRRQFEWADEKERQEEEDERERKGEGEEERRPGLLRRRAMFFLGSALLCTCALKSGAFGFGHAGACCSPLTCVNFCAISVELSKLDSLRRTTGKTPDDASHQLFCHPRKIIRNWKEQLGAKRD